MRFAHIGFILTLAPLVPLLGIYGCTVDSSEEGSSIGSINLHLTGVSAAGLTYRLRNGSFTVSGVESAEISTEDNPDAASVQLELPAGNYLMGLAPGWGMEREVDGVFEPVEAVLTSDNPAAFAVVDQQVTSVNFAFRAGDDIIQLGNGIVDLTISVDDGSCPTGTTECSGACVDLSVDAAHCGACEHSCGGGDCLAGVCQPFALATGQTTTGLGQLGISDTHVYWGSPSDGHSVFSVPKNGGTVQTLANNISPTVASFPPLAVSDTHVFWDNKTHIRRANPDGTIQAAFEEIGGAVDQIVVSNGRVYWNERTLGGSSNIFSKSADSSGTRTLEATRPNPITMFAAAAGCVYYRSQDNPFALFRLCPSQAPVTIYTSNSILLSRNHADNGEHLFFADRNVGLLQVPLGGTTPSTITSGQANLSAPIADGGLLYYFDGDNGGVPACTNNWSLQKVDAAPGSTPTTLIPAPMPCPQNLTMDDDSLYWVNQNTGTIMKMAKPLP